MMSKSGEGKFSEISPVLFLDADEQSMRFYVRPGPTKTQLHPLVTNGGGVLCRNQEPGTILLVDPGDVTSAMMSTGQKYISTKYIRDCVDQNLQLDLEDYVISVGPSVQTRMATRHLSTGRLSYSLEDDAAILKFMEKCQYKAKGNLVWKEMENRHVTSHSWQSMKDRFLKHLRPKLKEKSPKKSPSVASNRKSLSCTQSPIRKKKDTQTSEPNVETVQKSPQNSTVTLDSSETQIVPVNDSCPMARTSAPPSPERASSPPDVLEAMGDVPQASSDDCQDESSVPVQEQETPIPVITETPRLDEDGDARDGPDGSNEHSSPQKSRKTTLKRSTPKSKKLGILERAAKEFEDSDWVDESDEGEDPCDALTVEPSDVQESSASSALPATDPEHLEGAPQDSGAQERPGPSSTSEHSFSNAHVFIFESESQEDSQTRTTPAESLSRDVVDAKEHLKNLMRDTRRDLVEVTKALLKASGDVTRAKLYLLEGYNQEIHGPLWTHLDDVLLLADPYELQQLEYKFGEEEVTRRKAFLKLEK